jgi:hypothetical protein
MVRAASGILNALPPSRPDCGCAAASSASAAARKLASVAGWPRSASSARSARHGLCATPPRASRTSATRGRTRGRTAGTARRTVRGRRAVLTEDNQHARDGGARSVFGATATGSRARQARRGGMREAYWRLARGVVGGMERRRQEEAAARGAMRPRLAGPGQLTAPRAGASRCYKSSGLPEPRQAPLASVPAAVTSPGITSSSRRGATLRPPPTCIPPWTSPQPLPVRVPLARLARRQRHTAQPDDQPGNSQRHDDPDRGH